MGFSGLTKKKRKPLSHPEPDAVQSLDPGPPQSTHVKRPLRSFAIVMVGVFLLSHCTSRTGPAAAPRIDAHAANQLDIAGNACGPTALLNSFRFGSPACQQVADAIPGDTDRAKLRHIIIHNGGTWSSHIPQRYRWSRRGINAADLTDIANELGATKSLPPVRLFIPQNSSSPKSLLRATYNQLAGSLRQGFPPVAGLRRYNGTKLVNSHFVTILQVPDALDKHAQEFSLLYIDPVGGKKSHGNIRLMKIQQQLLLVADLPDSPLGKNHSGSGSYVTMDSLIALP